jgi:coiled-coil domain-containing protein 55
MKSASLQQEIELRASKLNQKQPKYISQILEAQKQRKREQDIIYNKMLQKEKDKEGNTFADKDKYVTAAYKKRLAEDKLWEEEQARIEQAEDVTKKDNLTGFYSNFLNQVASGKEAMIKPSKPKEETKKQPPKQDTQKPTTPNDKPPVKVQESKDKPSTQTIPSSERPSTTDKKVEPEHKPQDKITPKEEPKPTEDRKRKEEETPADDQKKKEEEAAKKLARKHDDQAIADAKARYLARKAQMASVNQSQT